MKSAGPSTLGEVAWTFLRLGCLSFGGPVAHIGYFRAELVERRKWLTDAHFGDLVALCQFLPGPASSQVVFAVGMQRAGILGAIAASACFTLPSALLMIGFAYGVARVPDFHRAGWLHGLKLAAVAVVAQAVWAMASKLCPDRARATLCLGAAAVLGAAPGAIAQLGVISMGGLVGFLLYRKKLEISPASTPPGRHLVAAMALAAFFGLLLFTPVVASLTDAREAKVFDSFYRSGSLVFGGGHVVLPLLRAEVVPRGWVTNDQFLAGYGAAQAIPGPLFTFSAYLGAAMQPGPPRWQSGLLCLVAIFLPAWLLIGGALPFWHRLRQKAWAQAALAGANASVVGVLLSALYNPVFLEGVKSGGDLCVALVAFGLLQHWKAPPWVVVLGSALSGEWLLTH
ncbi:MAG: chromate efflux transporter [Polyangiaceae bacterium]